MTKFRMAIAIAGLIAVAAFLAAPIVSSAGEKSKVYDVGVGGMT